MNSYLHGTDVQLTIDLKDPSGNLLSVSSIAYYVADEAGREIVGWTDLDGFVANAPTAQVVVPAASNTLAAGVPRSLREVRLLCIIGANNVMLKQTYVVQQADPLVVGVNTFQSYSTAQFTALDIPNIAGWESAPEAQRIAAMIDARERICRLSFVALTTRGMEYLDYVPEGQTNVGTNTMGWSGNLSELSPENFSRLPEDFRKALHKAQVAEADIILGGDPMEAKRQDGIVLDSVGESRQQFRPGKPLSLPVSRRALGYLSKYVTFSKRIGR